MYLIGDKGLGYDAALLGLETKMENRSEKRFGKGGERYFNRWLAWMRSSIKDKTCSKREAIT